MLVINDVKPDDAGEYTCQIDTEKGKAVSICRLSVLREYFFDKL